MKPFAFLASLAFLSATLDAQGNKYLIRQGKSVTGVEEFSIQDTPAGHTITCKSVLTVPGSSNETNQTVTYAPDWSFLRYHSQAVSGGVTQTAEAWRTGNKYRVRASGGAKSTERTVAEFKGGVFVLDDPSACLHQALVFQISSRMRVAAGDPAWMSIIPKRLGGFHAEVRDIGEMDALLDRKTVHAKRYRVYSADRLEVLAEASTGRLLAVDNVSQDFTIVREGFELFRLGGDCNELDAKFMSGDLEFPATLCLPRKGAGPFPVIVLVHGSGPLDRDETFGPNKPFRDLAWGLASRGIATFRYVKRTKEFPESFADGKVTLERETMADAIAALNFTSRQKGIDPKRVYLLGHSLGGQLAPLIAGRATMTAGLILLAAPARPLDEILEEQVVFQAKVKGMPEDDPQVKQAHESLARLRSGETPETEKVYGAQAGYWREFRSLKQLEALKELKIPVLVLQGGKDVQVRKTDYDILMKALDGKSPRMAEGHLFPNLNHLFRSVEGEPTGAEYSKAAPMSTEVIETISRWIDAHKQ